jgi:UDP-glucose 4-epimerase
MAMRIILTGAGGLIGSAVHRALAGENEVRTAGRSTSADMRVDLSDPDSVRRVDFTRADALIHCAGVTDEEFSDPGRAFLKATLGMSALVERAKAAKVSKFVYISSAHVYGPLIGTLNELSPVNPLHDYAIAHYASEQILRRATGPGFAGAVLRPCAVFGIPLSLESFNRWSLIPFAFPRGAVRDSVIALASSGLQVRNFVGNEDVAQTVADWLTEPSSRPFTAINPVGKESMSVFAFANLCAQIGLEITGRDCAVTRPEGGNVAPPPFQYSTVDERYVGSANLRDCIRQLTAALNLLDERKKGA